MAAIGSPARARASCSACHRPVSFSGMSRWPWMRVSTVQAVSPWRMAMVVGAWLWGGVWGWGMVMVGVACMWAASGGGWRQRRAHLARATGGLGKAVQCGVEQHAVDGRVADPCVFMHGRGFVDDGLRGGIAQHQAYCAAVQRCGFGHAPKAVQAPAVTPGPGRRAVKAVKTGAAQGVVARHAVGLYADLHQQPGRCVVALQARAPQ